MYLAVVKVLLAQFVRPSICYEALLSSKYSVFDYVGVFVSFLSAYLSGCSFGIKIFK